MTIPPQSDTGRRPPSAASTDPAPAPAPAPARVSGQERLVYDALSADPVPLDELVRLTGLDLAELCGGLERLAQAGLARDAGGWWERT